MKKTSLIITLIILCGCSSKKSYLVRGTLIEIRKNTHEFLIHHDEIPGFMMEMTMPFKVTNHEDINRFVVGDSLKFYLTIDIEKAYADDFKLLGKGTMPISDDMWNDEYSPIEIGKIITDVTLLDIDSNEVSLSSSDGKFRLISYVFTRCPMPNMCPAIIVKNQYLAQAFKNEQNMEFILVSFDYAYDTPAILEKAYGNILKSNSNLKIYSSTNHVNDVFILAGQSFVSFWGIEENDIGHTLRSILIDPERRLMKAFEGTDWRPESAEKDIKNILKTYN